MDLKVSQNSILPVCDTCGLHWQPLAPRLGVNLLHADHFTLSDAPAVPRGTSISTIRSDIAAFRPDRATHSTASRRGGMH